MATRSNTVQEELPQWAKFKPFQSDEEEQPGREDPYLRSMAYHVMSHRVDRALHRAFREESQKLLEEVRHFLWQFSPGEKRKRQRQLSETPTSAKKSPGASSSSFIQYSCTILPVMNLHMEGPSTLDRQVLASQLQSELSAAPASSAAANHYDEDGIGSAAVCVLNIHDDSNKKSDQLFREILRQCISKEPNPTPFLPLLNRERYGIRSLEEMGSKKEDGLAFYSYHEALIVWANHTAHFDSVIVLIENTEVLEKKIIDEFILGMASLRCINAIPISLLFLHMPYADINSIDVRGAEAMMKELRAPLQERLFNKLLKALIFDNGDLCSLPVLWRPSTLQMIQDHFLLYEWSVVLVAYSIKAHLAYYFAEPGSFLACIDDPLFMECHWQRLSSYCVSKTTRSFLFKGCSISSGELWQRCQYERMYRQAYLLMVAVFQFPDATTEELGGRRVWTSFLNDLVLQPPDHRIREIANFISTSPREAVMRKFKALKEGLCLAALPHQRTVAQKLFDYNLMEDSNEARMTEQLSDLNEVIVLVEALDSTKDHNISNEMLRLLEQWVEKWYLLGTSIYRESSSHSNRLSMPFSTLQSESQAQQCEYALSAEPRRHMAHALYHPQIILRKLKKDSCPEACSVLRAMENHILTNADVWFDRFCVNSGGNEKCGKMWKTFVFCIYQLLHCGIVRRHETSRNEKPVFEKAALVWTSGHETTL